MSDHPLPLAYYRLAARLRGQAEEADPVGLIRDRLVSVRIARSAYWHALGELRQAVSEIDHVS